MKTDNTFTQQELLDFVHSHVQSKINHQELGMVFKIDGGDMNFEEQLQLYETTLLEGLVNGIVMCGGNVEGVEV